MKKISCLIPAYNEGKSIGNILSIVLPLIGKYIYEVIIIDDGSIDDTKQIVKKFSHIVFLEHKVNLGKSKSVADGIKIAKGDYIFMLDADLKFLNEKNIIDIIVPIENNIAQVSISYRKNSWPLFPFRCIDYCSGERILPKSYLLETIDKMEILPSFGLEVFINRIIIKNRLKIKVVQWPNVENNFSWNKRGWFKGIKDTIKIWWNVLQTISIFEMYSQNIKMSKNMVKEMKSRTVLCNSNPNYQPSENDKKQVSSGGFFVLFHKIKYIFQRRFQKKS